MKWAWLFISGDWCNRHIFNFTFFFIFCILFYYTSILQGNQSQKKIFMGKNWQHFGHVFSSSILQLFFFFFVFFCFYSPQSFQSVKKKNHSKQLKALRREINRENERNSKWMANELKEHLNYISIVSNWIWYTIAIFQWQAKAKSSWRFFQNHFFFLHSSFSSLCVFFLCLAVICSFNKLPFYTSSETKI